MKGHEERRTICQRCGKEFTSVPALSRDGHSMLCPDCGTREALESIGVEAAEQEKILETIHRHTGAAREEAQG